MFGMKWRRTLVAGLLVALAGLTLLAAAGCASNTKTGKVEGEAISIPLGGGDPTYLGRITVKLDDGTSVDATCDVSIARVLKGGEEVKVKKTNSGGWEVVGPVTK